MLNHLFFFLFLTIIIEATIAANAIHTNDVHQNEPTVYIIAETV